MKKFILCLILLLSQEAFSQITLDFQASAHLFYFKINNVETKYFNSDIGTISSTSQLLLYNLDGSLYKTIQIPANPNSYIMRIDWISETLFDTNPSNIEYLIFYSLDSAGFNQYQAKVIREDGTILLDEMNANPFYFMGLSSWDPMVYLTEEGTKLMLDYQYATGSYYQTKVFILPGNIPNGVLDNQQKMNNILSVYPNPNNGSFFINLHSNDVNSHTLDLYSTNGKLIDTYKSSGNLTRIDNLGLSEGIYLINTQFNGKNSTTKMIIKK